MIWIATSRSRNSHFPLQRLDDSSIIIPTDFESLRFLSRSNEAFPGHTLCPLMDERLLDYLDDKHNQQEIAAECGLLSAEEYDYQALHKLPADRRLVIKPRLGAGSTGVLMSQRPRQALAYLDSLPAEHRKEQIIQEYIDGEDYYYYALCHEGKIAISGCLKPLRTERDDLRTCVAASLEDSAAFHRFTSFAKGLSSSWQNPIAREMFPKIRERILLRS